MFFYVPGLCLLVIGGAPYINHKIMARKPLCSYFSTSFLKQPAGGASYYARRLSKSRPS